MDPAGTSRESFYQQVVVDLAKDEAKTQPVEEEVRGPITCNDRNHCIECGSWVCVNIDGNSVHQCPECNGPLCDDCGWVCNRCELLFYRAHRRDNVCKS